MRPRIIIFIGRMASRSATMRRTSTRRSGGMGAVAGRGDGGTGFCPLTTQGADTTSDRALNSLILLTTTTSDAAPQSIGHAVVRTVTRIARPNHVKISHTRENEK